MSKAMEECAASTRYSRNEGGVCAASGSSAQTATSVFIRPCCGRLFPYQNEILNSSRITRFVARAQPQAVRLAHPIGLALTEDAERNTPGVEGARGYRDALFAFDGERYWSEYVVGPNCPTQQRHL